MLPRLTLSVLAIGVCSAVQAANFSGTYFFGDSLTDSGSFGSRFTTNPGVVWSEVLAARYGLTALTNNAGNPTGTNYAQGGSQVNTTPGYSSSAGSPTLNALSVQQQIDKHLPAGAGADSQALYSVWAGANDIFYQTQFAGTLVQAATFAASGNWAGAQAAAQAAVNQANGTGGSAQAGMQALANGALAAAQANSASGLNAAATQASGLVQLNIIQAAKDTVAAVSRLSAAGARYIILPNLPNIGDTPAGTASGATGKATLNGLSGLYNTTLSSELKRAGVQAIFLDINRIGGEIASNPMAYGFTNISTPACGATPSLICGPGNLVSSTAPDTHYYADGVHPTTAAHRLIAQYAAAVIDAPLQMAQLPNVALRNARAQKEVLEDRLTLLRTGAANTQRQTDFFFNLGATEVDQDGLDGFSGTTGYGRQITLGWDKRIGETDHVGLAFAYSDGNHEFGSQQGEFDLSDASITLYGGKVHNGFYMQGYGQFGSQSYDNIQRRITLGSATRTETAEAKGIRFGAGVGGGYNWTFGALQTGPMLGVDYQTLKVNNFHEAADDSTAMSYEEQKRKSLLGTFGWSLESVFATQAGQVWRPFAQVAYKHDFKDDERQVTAGLKTAPARFSMTVDAPDDNYVQYKLGIAADFKGWKGALSYTGASAWDEGDYRVYNLTVSSSF